MSDELFTAIHNNDLQQVSRLIERAPDVARARNQNGVSALMQAVYENSRRSSASCVTQRANSISTKRPRLVISPVAVEKVPSVAEPAEIG
jgi:ankyrin repeat protein